jgi:polar amino acid transport system substrate-binding protein
MLIKIMTLILISLNSFAQDKVITLVGDYWCPWNCNDPTKQNLGIAVDIAKAIYEPKGYTVEYIMVPWVRAVNEVLAGNYTAAIAASPSDSNDFIFPNVPLFENNYYYAVSKDSNFKYIDNNSFKGEVIGIVQGYHFTGQIGKYIDDNYQNSQIIHKISGDEASALNIKALINKHTDICVDDQYVIKYVASINNMSNDIKIVDSIQDHEKGYLAFSPALKESKELAALWDETYPKLVNDGTIKKILTKYHIN